MHVRRWQTSRMVTLLLDSGLLEVVLSPTERLLAFHKGNVSVERTAISKVQLTDDAWTWLRGIHSPGTYIKGIAAMGTWRSTGGADFALIRRHRAGVVIDLEGHSEFERLVLTTRHGLALVQALRLDVADEAADVAEIAAEAKRSRAPKRSTVKPAPAAG